MSLFHCNHSPTSALRVGLIQALGRMGKILAVVAVLAFVGCQPEAANSPLGAGEREPLGCPSLPASSGYSVSAQRGPDFVLCAVQPDSGKGPRVSLYIGNFPPDVAGLRFAGFTANSGLTWFSAGRDSEGAHTWLAYVPTGNPRSTVMAISVHAKDRQEFFTHGQALAQQLIGASIAP